jgi:hypothetical protein
VAGLELIFLYSSRCLSDSFKVFMNWLGILPSVVRLISQPSSLILLALCRISISVVSVCLTIVGVAPLARAAGLILLVC